MSEWLPLLGDFLKLVLAGLVAAWFSHRLREASDLKKKRQDWVASKLAEAYLMVTDALEHPGMSAEEAFGRKLLMEKAISTIDLYADAETKVLAHEIAEAYHAGKEWIVYEPLLTKLRDKFRENIGLEKLDSPVKTLKFGFVKAVNGAEETK